MPPRGLKENIMNTLKPTDFKDHFVSDEVTVAYDVLDNCEDSGYNLDVFVFAEDGTDITNELTQYERNHYIDEVEARIVQINEELEDSFIQSERENPQCLNSNRSYTGLSKTEQAKNYWVEHGQSIKDGKKIRKHVCEICNKEVSFEHRRGHERTKLHLLNMTQ